MKQIRPLSHRYRDASSPKGGAFGGVYRRHLLKGKALLALPLGELAAKQTERASLVVGQLYLSE